MSHLKICLNDDYLLIIKCDTKKTVFVWMDLSCSYDLARYDLVHFGINSLFSNKLEWQELNRNSLINLLLALSQTYTYCTGLIFQVDI